MQNIKSFLPGWNNVSQNRRVLLRSSASPKAEGWLIGERDAESATRTSTMPPTPAPATNEQSPESNRKRPRRILDIKDELGEGCWHTRPPSGNGPGPTPAKRQRHAALGPGFCSPSLPNRTAVTQATVHESLPNNPDTWAWGADPGCVLVHVLLHTAPAELMTVTRRQTGLPTASLYPTPTPRGDALFLQLSKGEVSLSPQRLPGALPE